MENHYSHAWPAGGGRIPLGVFCEGALRGAIIYSTGANTNAHKLVEGSERHQFLELTRLWLDDRLGKNSEALLRSTVDFSASDNQNLNGNCLEYMALETLKNYGCEVKSRG